MASPNTVTIGGQDYDVYENEVAATNFLQADVSRHTAWGNLTVDDQRRALVTATRRLDRLTWKGEKNVDSQPLAFPRSGLEDKYGNDLSASVVPEGLLAAFYLLAADIAQTPSIAETEDLTGTNVRRVKAGSVEIERFRSESGTRLPVAAFELVSHWLDGSGEAVYVHTSGLDAESQVEQDPYGLNKGYL